jgi:parallel beta-helix repeat protein
MGVCLALAIASAGSGKIIYVDDDAPPGGDGKSWATAYPYLQDALADARSADKPVEVRVAQGVYKPDQGAGQKGGDRLASFDLFSGVGLIGGYAGIGTPDPNALDVKLYKTVLSGDLSGNDVDVGDPCDLARERTRSENSCNVVEIVRASGVRLEGLTITAGHGNIGARERVASTLGGAGARIHSSQGLLVKDCRFLDNYAGLGPGGCGIGDSTNVVIEGSTFARNSRGGIAVGHSSGVTLAECEITANYSTSDAGGMAANGDITVVDCVFSGNMAPPGGGEASDCLRPTPASQDALS